MADLPADRIISGEPPFTNTGMDYFGPFEIKRGRTVFKRYGVIFTCLVTRAVHLEVAASLTTDSCINAIRRFVSRRGKIKKILSDNGTNFVGANRELKEEITKWNQKRIGTECQQQGIEWTFNPPSASHFGGIWERLIRTVRKILFDLMKEQCIKLDDEGLATLFCEVECILNSRPLTKSSDDPNDLAALTPNDLLLVGGKPQLSPGEFEQRDSYVRKRWRQIQYLAEIFWKRWSKEYLTTLQTRQKWEKPQRNVQQGDVVLIMDNTPRNTWSLARVIETRSDAKGLVRTAKVKTKGSTLERPIHKLCMLLENEL